MKKYFLLIGVLLVICLAGCNQKADTLSIGVIAPLSGTVASYGQDLKLGIDIAAEEEGVNMLYQDSKGNAGAGLNAMKHLHSINNINFFIGDATTTVTLSLGEEIGKTNSFLLVPIASGDAITSLGENIFMNCPRNEKQAVSAVDYILNKFKYKKIGIIYQQFPYGVELSEKFTGLLKNNGLSPLFIESFGDTKGIKDVLLKIKNAHAEIIFIPMEYESAALVLKQAEELGIESAFIGTDGAYSERLFELAGEAAEGFYLTLFPIDTQSDYYKKFEEKFKAKYNRLPNIFSCYGYESAKNLIYALKQAGNDVEAVKTFFHTSEFPSFTGNLKFDENGEVIRNFGLVKVVDRKFVIEND